MNSTEPALATESRTEEATMTRQLLPTNDTYKAKCLKEGWQHLKERLKEELKNPLRKGRIEEPAEDRKKDLDECFEYLQGKISEVLEDDLEDEIGRSPKADLDLIRRCWGSL